jgi:nicotinamide phosphoribosyltransferase
MNKRIEPELNFISDTADSYKDGHWRQREVGMQQAFSFFESRGGLFPTVTFFGLQYYLKRYLIGEVVTPAMLDEAIPDAERHFNRAGMINVAGWRRIISEHGGCLPIRICAVPEGTTVPVGHALMTIESLDELVPEIGQFEETILSMIWYPCTVATQSRAMRAIILNELEATGDPTLIDFKLHDFGFRGSTSVESAGIGGMAHLVNFKGTDTKIANKFARTYYGEPMAGYSVPAAEHFTITSWGRELSLIHI